MYIPDKFVPRKCVFQKEISCRPIRQICRELIQRCCMTFIQTWQRFLDGYPCFCFCFPITFDLLLTNTSRLDTPSTPTILFDCDFHWWPRAKQITNSNMVWYLNMTKSTYSHWSKHVGENLPSAMHFIIFVTFMLFFSEIARLCSFIIDTFLFCK